MVDQHGRNIHYFRVSITDRCNLRCNYCIGKGAVKFEQNSLLSFEEIVRISRLIAKTGVDTIRVTGGEPLVRKNVQELVRNLKNIEGINYVTLTTNGILLAENLSSLINAGLTSVNISLDTLNKHKFKQITGCDQLYCVKKSIYLASTSGLKTKVNCALQKGVNDDEIVEIASLAQNNDLDVRFIEMMPIGQGKLIEGVSNEQTLEKIRTKFYNVLPQISKNPASGDTGPAKYYTIEGFKGRIGFISAMHGKFCNTCNRVRLTSTGYLKCCLASEIGVDLKLLLRSGASDEKLNEVITQTIFNKTLEHNFENPLCVTEAKPMNEIGG